MLNLTVQPQTNGTKHRYWGDKLGPGPAVLAVVAGEVFYSLSFSFLTERRHAARFGPIYKGRLR